MNGIVGPASGKSPAIGCPPAGRDRRLTPLPKRQAIPALRCPQAHAPIAAATDQLRSGRTPGQRVHDRVRLAPGLQVLPTLHIPDEELPAASASATTGQSCAIGAPGHAHDDTTMPLELL